MTRSHIIYLSLAIVFLCSAIMSLIGGDYRTAKIAHHTSKVPYFHDPELTPIWYESNSAQKLPKAKFPQFSLIDQSGKTLSRADLAGKLVVANFFFTQCSNVCPNLTSSMARVRDAFKNRPDVMLLSHSVTPEFDIVPVLNAYANANNIDGKQWRVLTGSSMEISKVAHDGYFVPRTAVSPQGFIHTELFMLIDGEQRVRGVYNGTLLIEINQLVSDIKDLISEKRY